MRARLKTILAISLPVQVVLVGWAASRPDWVERWYSQGLYTRISGFFRMLYGWVPFSVGDLLYFALGVVGLGYLIRHRRRRVDRIMRRRELLFGTLAATCVSRRAAAASRIFSASFQRIEAQPSGEITE